MDRELTAATWQRDTTRHRHMLSGRLRLARPLVRPAARGMCSKDFDEELGLRRSAMSKALRQQPKPQPRQQQQQQRYKEPLAEDPRATGPVARIATAALRPRAAEQLVGDYGPPCDSHARTHTIVECSHECHFTSPSQSRRHASSTGAAQASWVRCCSSTAPVATRVASPSGNAERTWTAPPSSLDTARRCNRSRVTL